MVATQFRAAPLRAARPARAASVVVRAEDKNKLSFGGNKRSGLGYTDEDSAGQSNIFAVEPKQYVQGSARDTNTAAVPNAVYAITAAVVGAAAIAAGVSLAPRGGDGGPVYDKSLASVSAYAAKFETARAPAVE